MLLKKLFVFINIILFVSLEACQGLSGMGSNGSEGSQGTVGGSSILFSTLNFIMLAFFAYYFIVLKPQTLEQDEHKKFLDGLSNNDEVITSGGIIGKVVNSRGKVITLEISPKVNIKVLAKNVKPYIAEK